VDAWSERLRPDAANRRLPAGGPACIPATSTIGPRSRTSRKRPAWITGKPPTPAEIEWARFITLTPHYVLSSTLTSAVWPTTRFIHGLDEITALKQQPGKDIYLVGGARTTASLIDAGLVDELRLIAHPLIAGEGKVLFATNATSSWA